MSEQPTYISCIYTSGVGKPNCQKLTAQHSESNRTSTSKMGGGFCVGALIIQGMIERLQNQQKD